MTRKALYASAAIAIALSPAAARAADINEAGAKQILDSLTYYLPKNIVDTGVITVKPATQRYEMSMDFQKLFNSFDAKAFSVAGLKPIVYFLTPQDDGLWKTELNQPLDMSGKYTIEGKQSAFTYKIDKMSGEMMFDPAIGFFRSGSSKLENVRMSERGGPSEFDMTMASMSQDLRLENFENGKGDLVSNISLSGFQETVMLPPPAKPVVVSTSSVDGRVQMDKVGLTPLRDLIIFVLDAAKSGEKNLSPEKNVRLKQLIKANTPLLDNLIEDIHVRDLKVSMEDNQTYSLADFGYKVAFNGLKPDASFGVELSGNDVGLPDGLLPPSLLVAVPKSASMGVSVSGLNLEGVMSYLAEHADFTKKEPLTPQQSDELGKIVLPSGKLHIEYDNVTAKSDVYDVALSGDMWVKMEDSDKPVMDINIVARDFDKTIKFMQDNAGAVPQLGQAAFMGLMMKGFAKEQPDGSMLWNVKLSEGGDVTINGQAMKM